ncbi:MAG: hypothetical protein JSS66_02510 [Armatimonadetes bacterium]|nr:hypothetical protein [Armatimonadota bacterium]
MRSRGRGRKRSKVSIDPAAALWALFALNVVVGLAVSPLTAVQKVRVVGAPTGDEARIEEAVQALRDKPLLRVNGTQLRSSLEANPEVLSSEFLPNPFGRAVVKVRLRQPVARLLNSKVYVDKDGTAFRSGRVFEALPQLMPPKKGYALGLSVLGSWESGKAAYVCEQIAAQIPNVPWIVAVSERGDISLQAEGGATVDFGSSEGLPRKIEKLRSLVEAKPELLKMRRINLAYPEAPMGER